MRVNQSNNKRIARNTAMLYIRMLLIMGVTLYTTRIVLRILGVEDFGIYNVVGGVITMASFLSASMSSAIQRFLSFELGKNNLIQVQRVFSMSINLHLIVAIAIFILAETFGLWFINTQLAIPAERLIAANWVYQFSIFAFIVNIISVPYNAVILAYEKMNIFAYIGIVEVLLKLTAAFALNWFGFDKLALYAIFIFIISLIVRIFYGIYVKRNIQDCTYSFFWDKKLFNTLLNFAGWNLWGNIAFVTYNQGINILLNIFFGPAINAARAIAYQVNSALNSFVANFQVALKPQIIKSYAIGDNSYMHSLIFSGAKYSFFLMILLCAPIILSTSQILNLWLDTVPAYTIVFCQLVLIETIINSLSGTLMSGAQASGKIKLYQGLVGGLLMLILPISYYFLHFGYPPETTLYISISFALLALIFRVIIVSSLLIFSKVAFLKKVLFPASIIALLTAVTGMALAQFTEKNISSFLLANLTLIFVMVLSIVFIGLRKSERSFLKTKILKILTK